MIAAWRSPSAATVAAILLSVCACRPNPRNDIPILADTALDEVSRTAPGQRLCVDRVVAPWRPAAETGRTDPPPPPGYDSVLRAGFRGGGGLKGATAGGMTIGGSGCFDLRGPLVDRDRAMVEVHQADTGLNVWLQRTDGDWRVVTTTTSVYAP